MTGFKVLAGCLIFAVVHVSQGVPPSMPPIKLNIRRGEDGESFTKVAVNLFINKDSCECLSDSEPCLLELVFPDEEEGVMASPCHAYARYCCKMKVNYDDIFISSEIQTTERNALEEQLVSNTPDTLDKQPRETNWDKDADSKTETFMVQEDSSDFVTSHQVDSSTVVSRPDNIHNSQDSENLNLIPYPNDIFRGQKPLPDNTTHHIFRQGNSSSLISQQSMQVAIKLFKEILRLQSHVQKRSVPEYEPQPDSTFMQENSTRKSKMLMCSCTTMNDCFDSWALIEDRPEVVVKTSLRCEHPDEVTCCLGEIIPPRTFKVLNDKPVDSSEYGQSGWNPIITSALQNLVSWIMS